jgi:hypothetical protein
MSKAPGKAPIKQGSFNASFKHGRGAKLSHYKSHLECLYKQTKRILRLLLQDYQVAIVPSSETG